jgi:hypothetical protein
MLRSAPLLRRRALLIRGATVDEDGQYSFAVAL